MAHPEIILLTQIIEDGNYQILKDNDVDVTYFTTQEGRAVYRLLTKRFHNRTTYGTVPSMDLVRHTVQGFRPVSTGDDVDMLVEDLLASKLRNDLLGLSEEITDLVDRDQSEKAVRAVIDASTQLGKSRGASRDINLASAIELVEERYDLVSDGQGMLGIPFPWQPLNEATLGMQPGQLFIIYGRPGMMKTWTAILVACHAYLSANARVLFYTREMTEVEILMRMAAVIARVDYSRFRKGRLQPAVRDEVFEILYGLREEEEIIAERDGARRKAIEITTAADLKDGHTVRGLREKALEYDADIVVADGIYRMGDARTGKHSMEWTNLTHVSQDLKEGAKRLRIPIVGVTQANRGNDLAFSDSFLQEADLALRCVLKENELVYINRKLREDQLPAFSINAFPATNFTLKGQLSVDDAMALRTADDQAAHRHAPKDGKDGGRKPAGRRLPGAIRR